MRRIAVLVFALGLGSMGVASALHPELGAVQVALAGIAVSLASCGLGVACGLCAVFGPRALDSLLSRGVEASAMLPTSLALIFALSAHASLVSVLLLLSAVRGLRIARCVRGEVLRLQQLPQIEAARALGADAPRQVARYYLPALHELLALELGSGVVWCLSLAAAVGFMRSDLSLAGASLLNATPPIQALVAAGAVLIGAGCLLLVGPRKQLGRSAGQFG